MDCFAERLESWIRGRRVVVVGVGQDLRGDDGAGPWIARYLLRHGHTWVFDAGTVPENFLGPLLAGAPDAVLFVDAADWGGEPGAPCLEPASALLERCTSTHALSLALLARALGAHGIACWLLGIQPLQRELGAPLSPAVADAIHVIAPALHACLDLSEASHA